MKSDEIAMQKPVPLMQEVEPQSRQAEFCQNENKSKKIQNDVAQISTVFGERMHKKIMEIAKEEEKQKSLKLNGGKEIVEENNKENGSRSNLNNKSISVTRDSGTGNTIKERIRFSIIIKTD